MYPTSIEGLVIGLVLVALAGAWSIYSDRKQKNEDKMEDWTYTDIEPVVVPEDQQEIEWVDYKGTLREGVYESHGKQFYAGPNEWNYVADVQKWRPLL